MLEPKAAGVTGGITRQMRCYTGFGRILRGGERG